MSEKEIAEQYPEMFEHWHKSASELEGAAPPIAVFGFQCGEG